jgi:hypothetical protein
MTSKLTTSCKTLLWITVLIAAVSPADIILNGGSCASCQYLGDPPIIKDSVEFK